MHYFKQLPLIIKYQLATNSSKNQTLPSIHSLLILVERFRVASRISRSISVALTDDRAYTVKPA